MYGLAAIQQANGWAMAAAGACIVLCGLAVLSFLISLLPRLTGFFEAKPPAAAAAVKNKPAPMIVPDRIPDDPEAAATLYIALTEDLGELFSLVDLHAKSKELGLPHPHLSINRFRDAGFLMPAGEGLFSWKPLSS